MNDIPTVLFIIILIFSYWHRDPWLYVIATFDLLLYGLYYAGAIADIKMYMSSLLIIMAVYTLFKAAWDRGHKTNK